MIEPLNSLALSHFLLTGAVLFVLGLIGFVTRRNMIVIFLCTEMMFQGVGLSLVAFSGSTSTTRARRLSSLC